MRDPDIDDSARPPRTTRRTLLHGVGLSALLGLCGAAGARPTDASARPPEAELHGDEIDWYRTEGDAGIDQFRDLTATDGGGVTTIGVTTEGNDGREAWQHHWATGGEQGWTAHRGDAGTDSASAVTRARAGCYALCGRSAGGADGTDRVYVVETDDRGNDIVQTAGGGYAVAGVSGDAAALADLGPGGTVRWTRTFECGRWAEAVSVVERDEGYVLGGTVADDDERDFLLVGTDPAGGERWRRTYSVGEDDRLAQCIETDEGYLLAGTTEAEGAFTTDALFVRTDRDGTVVWERTWGEGGEEYTAAGAAAVDGGYVFVGTRSVDIIGPEVVVGRLDEDGERTEQYTFGTARPDVPLAVTVADDGLVGVCGFRDSPSPEDGTDGFVTVVRPDRA